MLGIVVHLDDQAVRAAGRRSKGHGLHQAADARGMAGIDNNRQVGQLMQHRHATQIQGVAGSRFKGADAPLAEDHLLIAAGHDVFRAHEQLLQGVGQTALEKDGLVDLPQLLEQLEVLHVARPHLDHIHVLKQRQMVGVHDLRYNGQARFLLCLLQQADAFAVQALEGIGRRAGLERTAAKERGARGLDGLRHGDNLLFAFHRAGPGDNLEHAPAQLHAAAVHHRVRRMELAVGLLVGLLNAAHRLHVVQGRDHVLVHTGGVTHQAHDGGVFALGQVNLQPHLVEERRQPVDLCLPCFLLENDDHLAVPPCFHDVSKRNAPQTMLQGDVRMLPRQITPCSCDTARNNKQSGCEA